MARTDAHSPKNLVTEDYEYLYAIDNKSPWALGLDIDFLSELNDYEPATADRGHSQCHHCGAHIRYAAFLRYIPTGRTIVVGETCLENRFERATADFHRLRKLAELDRQKQRIVKARDAFVAANPDLAFLNDEATFLSYPEHITGNWFIADVGRKLRHYGELSEKQINSVRSAILRESERAERRAAEKASENWIRVPDSVIGRVVVSGTILAEKVSEGPYGTVHKMLLKVGTLDGDWKLWVTKPASMLREVEKGDIVTIKATITRSDQDPCFAFGKRPQEVTS